MRTTNGGTGETTFWRQGRPRAHCAHDAAVLRRRARGRRERPWRPASERAGRPRTRQASAARRSRPGPPPVETLSTAHRLRAARTAALGRVFIKRFARFERPVFPQLRNRRARDSFLRRTRQNVLFFTLILDTRAVTSCGPLHALVMRCVCLAFNIQIKPRTNEDN